MPPPQLLHWYKVLPTHMVVATTQQMTAVSQIFQVW